MEVVREISGLLAHVIIDLLPQREKFVLAANRNLKAIHQGHTRHALLPASSIATRIVVQEFEISTLGGLEEDCSERRQRQCERVRTPVLYFFLCHRTATVPHSASAVFLAIAVQNLFPPPATGNADPIVFA